MPVLYLAIPHLETKGEFKTIPQDTQLELPPESLQPNLRYHEHDIDKACPGAPRNS